MEIFNLIVLGLSGALLVFGGGMRLLRPIKSYCLQAYSQKHADDLANDADMLNEMRADGAVMLFGGLAILAGTVMPGVRLTSFAVGVVIFLGFAVGRSVSLAIDGKPNKDLVNGLISEILFGVLHSVCLVVSLT